MNVTVIIQTRGRPEILKQSLERTLPNVALPTTTLLVEVDDDDQPTLDILDQLPTDKRIKISVKPREDTRGPKYDRALIEAPADIYLCSAEKVVINRDAFDAALVEAALEFPDGIGCVCTPMVNASFPGLQAPTAKLVELMGYIYPPHFPFWFIDHWLDDVCRMIDRYIMVDIKSDHFSLQVPNTIGLKHLDFWSRYFDSLAGERRDLANKIIDALDDPTWRKVQLRRNFPMVEYRSVWVNEHVRANAAAIEQQRGDGAADERYLRILKTAVDHLMSLQDMKKAA